MAESDAGSRAVGWATSSIDNSIRRAFIVAAGSWQVVMACAVLSDRSGVAHAVVLTVVHLAYAGSAAAALRSRLPYPAFVGLGLATIVVDFALAKSLDAVVAFAAVWMWNLFHMVPVMVLRGRWRCPLMTIEALGLPIALYWIHPEWTASLPIAAFGTSISMQAAGWYALRGFTRLGRTVDRQAEHAAADRQAVEVKRIRSALGRESTRVLHDTVINTLGAIASGGGATHDQALVRARCERDVLTMAALESGDLSAANDFGRPWSALRLLGQVDFVGMSPAELDAFVSRIPPSAARAMRAVAQEAVLNALKHAGVETVLLIAREGMDGRLDILVRDHGRGMSQDRGAGLGVRAAMVERARASGVAVDLQAVPGVGTDVIIGFHPDVADGAAPEEPALGGDVATFVLRVRRRASWAAALGTGAVAVAIELANQSVRLTWTYATIAVLFSATGLTALAVRRHRVLPRWAAATLVLTAPVAFATTLPSVDFGRDEPYLWQAITAAPVAILLLEFGRSTWPAGLASGAVLLTALGISVELMAESPDAAAIVVVGAIALCGVVAGWASFRRSMSNMSHCAAVDFEAAASARVALATRNAADEAMERWRAAGLRSALDLLRRIVAGQADPADPAVRSRAAEEEAFLRQLIMLSPDSIHLNPWFHRVLAEARERGVGLRLRTGDVDVDSRETAESLGSLLRRVVESAEPDQEVFVTFGGRGGTRRLAAVGPKESLRSAVDGWSAPTGWQVSQQEIDDEAIVEVTR